MIFSLLSLRQITDRGGSSSAPAGGGGVNRGWVDG